MTKPENTWAQDALVDLAQQAHKEQRKQNRWKWIFRGILLIYLFWFLHTLSTQTHRTEGSISAAHTALVEINGEISAESLETSADVIVSALRSAFESEGSKAVILRINSPGGSPVQSGYIYDEINRLKKNHDKKVYAVVSDICASGGYYIASAADEIYANQASLVGSIGVRMDTFGLIEAAKKLGVEPRTITAGKNKALADPFNEMTPTQRRHLQGLADDIHSQFIMAVTEGRSTRLDLNTPDLFSGLIWTGQQALSIGLVDAIGSSSYVAREIIKAEQLINYSVKQDWFERLIEEGGLGIKNIFSQVLSTQDRIEIR